MATRLERLGEEERKEVRSLAEVLRNPTHEGNDRAFARFGELMAAADAYDPLPHDDEVLGYQPGINHRVWGEARVLRSSGELLALGSAIRCPVIAIHGDRDPHPAAGVREPLSRVLADFRFVLLLSAVMRRGMSGGHGISSIRSLNRRFSDDDRLVAGKVARYWQIPHHSPEERHPGDRNRPTGQMKKRG